MQSRPKHVSMGERAIAWGLRISLKGSCTPSLQDLHAIVPRIVSETLSHALQAQQDVFNALEDSPAGNDMDFVAKLHLVEKHIRNNNLKLTFADRLGIAEDDEGEMSSQVILPIPISATMSPSWWLPKSWASLRTTWASTSAWWARCKVYEGRVGLG